MGKSSRRNRPSKAQRKKNAITARNAHYYNTVLCKSTNKVQREFTSPIRTTTPTGNRSTVVPTYFPIVRQGRIRQISSKYTVPAMTNYIFT